jgi:hypothetical protein
MINEDKSAERLYDNRPCHNNKHFKCLNYNMEKSAARAAWLPYFPTIPTPTSAAWIIPTSLPPSPIPRTAYFYFLYFFTPYVRVLFCCGEHLQQITEGICIAVI